MIYILVGNDTQSKSSFIKDVLGGGERVFLTSTNVSKELLNNYAMNRPLFGEPPAIIIDGLLKDGEFPLLKEDIVHLSESQTIFILLEDKFLAKEETKYKKYAEIKKFIKKEIKKAPTNNIFSLTDAFARKDKVKTWVLYMDAIDSGATPESIAGMIFWKIKTMILNNNKSFHEDELKKQSSAIVSLHHMAHRGETDFVVGLEQFILSSLS